MVTREEGSENGYNLQTSFAYGLLGDVDDEGDQEAQSDHPWLDKIDAQLQWRNGDSLFIDYVNLYICFEKQFYFETYLKILILN